jgi:hemoglobin
MAKTLFERLGGFGKVSKVVLEFYDRVLSNETLAKYFVGVDMKRQVDHQTKFFSYLMGGPASFTDEHLANVHKRLHITPEAFDEMALTLRETLEDFELDESDIAAVMSAFLSRRRLVMEAEAS